jgi:predicted nucleic acid-binding protein
MSGRAFLDTNLFVYGYDERDPLKRSIADGLIRSLAVEGEAVISYQVIQEFFNVVLLKIRHKMPHDDAQKYLNTTFRALHIVPPSIALVSDAIRIQERYKLSWYDSLIVSAAQQGGCAVLYSEDLQDGQQFGSVTVRNPFQA